MDGLGLTPETSCAAQTRSRKVSAFQLAIIGTAATLMLILAVYDWMYPARASSDPTVCVGKLFSPAESH